MLQAAWNASLRDGIAVGGDAGCQFDACSDGAADLPDVPWIEGWGVDTFARAGGVCCGSAWLDGAGSSDDGRARKCSEDGGRHARWAGTSRFTPELILR